MSKTIEKFNLEGDELVKQKTVARLEGFHLYKMVFGREDGCIGLEGTYQVRTGIEVKLGMPAHLGDNTPVKLISFEKL